MSRLGNILNAIVAKVIDWEKVGDVYWGSGSWTVPQNGFIEVNVTPSANNWYLYITDSFVGDTWSHTLSGTNTNRLGRSIPVRKGAVLSTAASNNVSSVSAKYFKLKTLGGVLLNRIISSIREACTISERRCCA